MMPLSWFWHAGKRTLLSFVPRLLQVDDAFAQRILGAEEYSLYLSMDPRDRYHACEVTKALIKRHPDASAELQRAALLHDVGKSVRPYNVWERILSHLYTPRHVPAEPILTGLRGAWQMHRHHAEVGAQLVLQVGGAQRVADLVAHHDKPHDHDAQKLYDIDRRY